MSFFGRDHLDLDLKKQIQNFSPVGYSLMYPFPPSTCSASRATCVAVSAEKRIAAAHSRARSPLERQPPEMESDDEVDVEVELLFPPSSTFFLASAFDAAE